MKNADDAILPVSMASYGAEKAAYRAAGNHETNSVSIDVAEDAVGHRDSVSEVMGYGYGNPWEATP